MNIFEYLAKPITTDIFVESTKYNEMSFEEFEHLNASISSIIEDTTFIYRQVIRSFKWELNDKVTRDNLLKAMNNGRKSADYGTRCKIKYICDETNNNPKIIDESKIVFGVKLVSSEFECNFYFVSY